MSGHSKWSTIKRKKAVIDSKRGAVFTKLAKGISSAVKLGGADPAMNFRLRLAIDKARAASMPMSNIENAITKASGAGGADQSEEILYEGYGPGGVAILVETLTDNRNRTVAELRHTFSKNNGNLGETGSVAWMFDQRGSIVVDASPGQQEALTLQVMELPVEDIEQGQESVEIFTTVEQLETVKQGLDDSKIAYQSVQIVMRPKNLTPITEEGTARQIIRLIEALEDNEDVQEVYTNFEIDEAVGERLGEE